MIATTALGTWLLVSSIGFDDARTAEAILGDYRAVAMPRSDPSRKDADSVRSFREAYGKAQARKNELALELFRSQPANDQVPRLLLERWASTMMETTTALATIVEIDQALPYFKDEKQAREASFMKVVAMIRGNPDHPELALPAVDDFIRRDPHNPRAAVLLNGFASEIKDVPLRVKILKRLVAEYPEHAVSKSARALLGLLENVGKPLELEFVDAIKQTPVSIQGLKGKVVVVDFWATWCGPCVAEMPRMKNLYAQFKDQGVEFIGVSLDLPREEGGLDKLKAFVARNEITWPQFYQGNGWDSEFSTKMGISSIPQLFLVDAEGKLASIDARGKLETLIPEALARARAKAKAADVSP